MNTTSGKILSVNTGSNVGSKKNPRDHCRVITGFGLETDAHAGSAFRQVSLLAKESIEKIRSRGFDARYGDFAENLTTEGIDLPSLPVGTKLMIGNDILLEVTQIGKVCHERCRIFHEVGDCVMPKEGVFARVIHGGTVTVGDSITIIDTVSSR